MMYSLLLIFVVAAAARSECLTVANETSYGCAGLLRNVSVLITRIASSNETEAEHAVAALLAHFADKSTTTIEVNGRSGRGAKAAIKLLKCEEGERRLLDVRDKPLLSESSNGTRTVASMRVLRTGSVNGAARDDRCNFRFVIEETLVCRDAPLRDGVAITQPQIETLSISYAKASVDRQLACAEIYAPFAWGVFFSSVIGALVSLILLIFSAYLAKVSDVHDTKTVHKCDVVASALMLLAMLGRTGLIVRWGFVKPLAAKHEPLVRCSRTVGVGGIDFGVLSRALGH